MQKADLEPGIDEVRNFWNQRPCNIRHSRKPVGTKEYFEEVEKRRYFVEPHVPKFAEFEKWAGRSVLEVGCGIGTDAAAFAKNGANYTGTELSEESLNITRQRFDVLGLNGKFLPCNAEELSNSLPAAAYDLVYSFGVVHHTPNQRKVIEEVRKVIKPDGEFRFMVYAKNSWKDAMIEVGLDQPEAQSGCPIATTYTYQMVDDLLKDQFQTVKLEQDHIFPFVIEKYIQHEYELQPWFAAMPDDMRLALRRRFGWHLLVTAKPI